jgi:hypothetical protein
MQASDSMIFQRGSEEKTIHDQLEGISECIRALQARMDERMDRMEYKMQEQYAAAAASADSVHSSLASRVDGTDAKVDRLSSRLDTRCDAVEKRLDRIAYAVGIRSCS